MENAENVTPISRLFNPNTCLMTGAATDIFVRSIYMITALPQSNPKIIFVVDKILVCAGTSYPPLFVTFLLRYSVLLLISRACSWFNRLRNLLGVDKKVSQFSIAFVRAFFLNIMAGGDRCRPDDVGCVCGPDFRRIMVAADTPFGSPQQHGWAGDLFAGVKVHCIHGKVYGNGGAIILAHSM